MRFNIWEGIYSNFAECPSSGEGFEGEMWASRSLERMEKLSRERKKGHAVPPKIADGDYLISILSAIVADRQGERGISLLDFGGGLGFSYLSVVDSISRELSIEYHIVESRKICTAGIHFFQENRGIHFHTSLPKIRRIDIILMNSVLQYIDDWQGLLAELAGYDPGYFLFIDLPAGDIPTFATAQNYYDSRIPYRFYNINEVISALSSLHYRLIFKSSFSGTYLGEVQNLPLSNFPEPYRLKNSCNLLFAGAFSDGNNTA